VSSIPIGLKLSNDLLDDAVERCRPREARIHGHLQRQLPEIISREIARKKRAAYMHRDRLITCLEGKGRERDEATIPDGEVRSVPDISEGDFPSDEHRRISVRGIVWYPHKARERLLSKIVQMGIGVVGHYQLQSVQLPHVIVGRNSDGCKIRD
jgi:hypothetical protein